MNSVAAGEARLSRRSFGGLAWAALLGLGLAGGCGTGPSTGTATAPEAHTIDPSEEGPAGAGMTPEKGGKAAR